MTLAVAPARRGRPSNATLSDSLARSRQVNADLRLELHLSQRESAAFAARVGAAAAHLISHASNELYVAEIGRELGYHAARRLAQTGGVL